MPTEEEHASAWRLMIQRARTRCLAKGNKMDQKYYYINCYFDNEAIHLHAKIIKETCPEELILAEDDEVVIFSNLLKIDRILLALRRKYRYETFDKEEYVEINDHK